MNKKIKPIKKITYLFIIIVVLIAATEFKSEADEKNKIATATKKKEYQGPFLKNDFVGFREALAFKESQGKYTSINTLGYLGKYQFGKETLKRLGVYDTKLFINNPELQERAFAAFCSVNKWILRKDIKRSVGKTINGIKITESGILAAAHLSGAGNVKKFLRSNGTQRFADAYGATISSYMKKFADYDVSYIKADRKAKA